MDKRDYKSSKDRKEIYEIISATSAINISLCEILFGWYINTKKNIGSNIFNDDSRLAKLANIVNKLDESIPIIKSLYIPPTDDVHENSVNVVKLSKMKKSIIDMVSLLLENAFKDEEYVINNPTTLGVIKGFIYGYYLKSEVLNTGDMLGLIIDEHGYCKPMETDSIYAYATLSIMKNIDKNVYLDRDIFPNKEINIEPIINTSTTPKVEKKPVPVPKAPANTVKQDGSIDVNKLVNRYSIIKAVNRKKETKIDVYEMYTMYQEGLNIRELAELFEISIYTTRTRLNNFVKDNNLPLRQYDRTLNLKYNRESKVKKLEELKESEDEDHDEELFRKAQIMNSKDIDKYKQRYTSSLDISVPKSRKQFVNSPVVFSNKDNIKLTLTNNQKKIIDKKGGDYIKLNDNSYYYVTPGDYLIFRNTPTPADLERYRSVKSY